MVGVAHGGICLQLQRVSTVLRMELKSSEQWKELVSSVDTFIFDCDGKFLCSSYHGENEKQPTMLTACYTCTCTHTGVLWLGTGEAVSGAQDVVKFLREKV